jgi:hypothetical protein
MRNQDARDVGEAVLIATLAALVSAGIEWAVRRLEERRAQKAEDEETEVEVEVDDDDEKPKRKRKPGKKR